MNWIKRERKKAGVCKGQDGGWRQRGNESHANTYLQLEGKSALCVLQKYVAFG